MGLMTENMAVRLSELGDLWNIFRTPGTLWHTTPLHRFPNIIKEGIRPSDGTIKSDYPSSLGSYFKSVCLFNFTSPSEMDALRAEDSWGTFLVDTRTSAKIFMSIDRSKMDGSKFIDQGHETYLRMDHVNDENRFRTHIVHVECWYKGIIDPSWIKEIVLIRRVGRPFHFEAIPFNEELIQKIDSLAKEWDELEQMNKEADIKSGKFDYLSLLLNVERKN